jgi:hypothetical protein
LVRRASPAAISLYDLFDPEAPPPDGQNYYRWGTPDSVVIDDATARFAEIRDELNASVDEDVLIPLMQEASRSWPTRSSSSRFMPVS